MPSLTWSDTTTSTTGVPAANYAEVFVGWGNHPDADVHEARAALDWLEVVEVDESVAFLAAQIAQEVGAQGPYLNGPDAIAAAVGRQYGAAVVSGDSDLTHQATRQVVDVETY